MKQNRRARRALQSNGTLYSLLSLAALGFGGLIFSAPSAGAQDSIASHSGAAGKKLPAENSLRVPKSKRAASTQPLPENAVADAVLTNALAVINEESDVHFDRGEFNHCINLMRIIVQGAPHDLEAYENASWLLWSTARNDEAAAILEQGIHANPNTYYLYDEMGTHYALERKDPARAIPYFEQAVKFKCPAMTWHSLAHCYEKTNQWDKAVTAWKTAAKYPGDEVAQNHLDRAQAELARRQRATSQN